MILFSLMEARDFHSLFTRCVTGRPRGPAPLLVVRFAEGKRIIVSTTTDGVMLMHTATVTSERDDVVVLPGSVLGDAEGTADDAVSLERQSKLRAVVRWQGRGQPQTLAVDLILPGKQHELPALPSLKAVPAKILTALHECGRSAARDSGRYALSKVQVQGKAGRVIGTDGKVALLYDGFPFAFTDDVLVPARAVFGSKPLSRINEVKLGRTATHLVVVAGPWSVWLPTESKLRYPDVPGVVPKHAATLANVSEKDARELLKILPTLPGNDEENRPVTLDASSTVTIRSRDPGTSHVLEVPLSGSTATGPAACLALDRRVLTRALSLGCFTLKLTPDKPVVVAGDGVMLLAVPLDPTLILTATASVEKPKNEAAQNTALRPIEPERNRQMEPHKMSGHTPARGDPPDPLEIAEELRVALSDAATKAARLVAALRHTKREKKALSALMTNLKQLNLGGGVP